MCYAGATVSETRAVAENYAIARNGAAGALVSVTIPTTVTVVATQTYNTYFAGLLGFDDIPVSADATAVCGRSEAVGALWPVAFDVNRYEQFSDTLECGDVVVIWEDDPEWLEKDEDGRVVCGEKNPGAPYGGGLDCQHLYEKANGTNIIANLDAFGTLKLLTLDRAAWVDFTAGLTQFDPCDDMSAGIGANEIKYRIDGEDNKGNECTPYLSLPDCYADATGNNGGAISGWNVAEDQRDGDIVKIPLYDPCYSGKLGELSECGQEVCTIDDNSGGHSRYYITGLMCLRIGIYDSLNYCPYDDWVVVGYLKTYDLEEGARVIVASVPCDENDDPPPECFAAPGYTTGEPALPGQPEGP